MGSITCFGNELGAHWPDDMNDDTGDEIGKGFLQPGALSRPSETAVACKRPYPEKG